MSKSILTIASANGFLAVGLGAFSAHGLDTLVSADLLETFQTGVEYHMYHALALFGTALLALHFPDEKLLRVSTFLFLLGILFFSGSLYVLSFSGMTCCVLSLRLVAACCWQLGLHCSGLAFQAGIDTRDWSMHVTINGNQTELDDDSSLHQLLQQLKIAEGRIAIELNGEIIPRSQFQQQLLSKGDRVEIVQAIGGG